MNQFQIVLTSLIIIQASSLQKLEKKKSKSLPLIMFPEQEVHNEINKLLTAKAIQQNHIQTKIQK